MHIIKNTILFLFLLTVMISTSAFAAEYVKQIEVVGNERIPTDSVLATISTVPGQMLDRERVAKDIKALYALQNFTDISFDTQQVSGGVKLIIRVVEKPLIGEIDFEGNKKIDDDKLKEEISITLHQALNEKEVNEAIEKIKELYVKKGYYLVEVNYKIVDGEKDSDEDKLLFEITENQKAFVRRVDFIGNRVYKDKFLRGKIKTSKKGMLSFLTKSGSYDEEIIKIDTQRLAYFYLSNGYFRVRVNAPTVTISKDKRYIYLTFEIYEGKQYKFGEVDIVGDILTTKDEIISLISTKKGAIYDRMKVDQDTQTLAESYGEQGYAFANVIPRHVPNDDTLTVDLIYALEKGDKIKIERINILGNTITRDKVIRRELEVVENDRYSLKAIEKSREKLNALGYFSEVNFATPRGTKDDTIELNINVIEKPTRTFNIGAAFSSTEHFIFNASISVQNLLGYGVGSSFMAEISKRRQDFMVSAQDPYFLDSEWIVGSSFYRTSYRYPDYWRRSLGGELTLGHRIFDYWSTYITYRIEDVDVSDFSSVVPQEFRDEEKGLTSSLAVKLQYDRRNNRMMPTKGVFGYAMNETSGAKLGGTNDFNRTSGTAQFYYPILKPLIFKQFAKAGYVKSLNDQVVPLYERYFLGGPHSLRGYEWFSVGPRVRVAPTPANPSGLFTYGGDKQVLFVTELEFLAYPKAGVGLVAFFDAGNAFGETEKFSVTNLLADYGFGLRWNSPFAPLRFEWGIPIIKRNGDESFQFNFSMGSTF